MPQSSLRPRYRYRLTRLGFHFLFVALFAIIGGSLRGFNLLLVLAGLLVSVVIVQWRQGRQMIRRTKVRRELPRGAFAGRPFSVHYELRNTARWLPLWMIRIEDQIWKVRSDNRRQVDSEDQGLLDAMVGSVPGASARRTSIQCRVDERGEYRLGPAITSTTFPFSMMKCDRLTPHSVEDFCVYPRLLRLRKGWQAMLPSRHGGDRSRTRGRSDHEGEFFGLRPWQSGDNVKHIHWRTTARIGKPAVRQFEHRTRHQISLIIDGAVSDEQGDAFELLLRLAATLIHELAPQRPIRMAVSDEHDDQHWASTPQGGGAIHTLLQRLTIAKTTKDGHPLALLEHAEHSLAADDVVVLSTRQMTGDAFAEAELSARSRSLAGSLHRSGRLRWLDVRSPDVRHWIDDRTTSERRAAMKGAVDAR